MSVIANFHWLEPNQEKLRERRKEMDISLRKLADKMSTDDFSCSSTAINNLENGVSKLITPRFLMELCKALEIPPTEFIGDLVWAVAPPDICQKRKKHQDPLDKN